MAVKKVTQEPAKILRKKTGKITNFNTPELKRLISDMADTAIKENGIGLAAPQINISKSIFIIPEDYAPETRTLNPRTWLSPRVNNVFINPKIVYYSKEKEKTEEGCLSVKGVYHPTTRSHEIVLRAKNEKGRRFKIKANGLLARIFQHETDHLNGILFIDKLHEQ